MVSLTILATKTRILNLPMSFDEQQCTEHNDLAFPCFIASFQHWARSVVVRFKGAHLGRVAEACSPGTYRDSTAAAVVNTTTTAVRKNKRMVPDEREMAAEAAKCRDPVRRKSLRKRARKAQRAFVAGRAVLPRSKVVQRPVVTKFWVSGRASEDRDEWTEEV